MPLVSFLLPCRDAESTLAPCLDSLLAQTMRDFEIVAVDDGSRDGTSSLLQACAERDSRLRVVRRPALGLVAALNAGLQLCAGLWIARMDADDRCHPERLEHQLAYAERHPDVPLIGCRVAFAGTAPGFAHYVRWQNELVEPEDLSLSRFQESPLAHPSVMFERSLPERFGVYRDGDFPEDYECWLRWMDAGVRAGKTSQTLVDWSDPPGRLSRTDPRYAPEAFFRMKALYLARWLARHNPFHPHITLWGSGRATRRRARSLQAQGIELDAYVDISPRKCGQVIEGRPVLHPDQLPPPGSAFVVPYVGTRDATREIRARLEARGYRRGIDFILAA